MLLLFDLCKRMLENVRKNKSFLEKVRAMTPEAIFLPSFGNRPSHLVGRDEAINGFIRGLKSPVGHPERATLIVGQRGMGKTALLLAFAESAENQGFLVIRATSGDEMLEDIIGAIQRKGTRYIKEKPGVKSISAGAFGFSLGLAFSDEVQRNFSFLNKMALLCDALEKHDKGIVVLVDEVQANTPSMRVLATTYQHLVGEGKNVVIAMAGLPHAISSVLNDEVLTFFNRAKKNKLEPLSLSAISVYYSSVFNDLGKSISPENLDQAALGAVLSMFKTSRRARRSRKHSTAFAGRTAISHVASRAT
ncbi:MAG: ATP-binding protein [Coriobacteriales bacterium]|nr:ATP-binding protein [Coriobacteriales bacterium]